MPPSSSATADAVDLAYSNAVEKLSSQLGTINTLDAKLGATLGALAALASLYSASTHALYGGLILLAPGIIALIGYLARDYDDPPAPLGFAQTIPAGKTDMQQQAISAIVEAYYLNSLKLRTKAIALNVSLISAPVAILAVLLLSHFFPPGK